MRAVILVVAAVLFIVPDADAASIVINNGLAPPNPANVINSLIPDSVLVEDSPSNAPTTVELASGGQVGDAALERLQVFGTSSILMTGGLVWDDIFSFGSSTVTMSGGSVQSGVVPFDSSTVTITGGTVSTGVSASGSSAVSVLGGTFGSVSGFDSSTVSVRGGQIAIIGQVSSTSILTIFGSGFALDGTPVPFGPIAPIAGQLTGVLESGESLDAVYSRESSATVLLVQAPEPTPLALGGMMLAALALWRRSRGVCSKAGMACGA